MKHGAWLLLMIWSSAGVCQETPRTDHAAYQSFFLVAAQLSRFVPNEISQLTAPTIQDELGFSDAEMRILNGVAVDCEARTNAAGQAKSRLIFEARLRSIESGDSAEWLARQLKAVDGQVERIVTEHLVEAQRLLGAPRFQVVSDYVRSSFAGRCFVTPCGAKKL